ncbi:hypothetical protein BS639_22995 [Rouxiella silvae]|uniref:Uncharacterized protein n=1 Tax=Rouxiella silvae TaxID=1646373 RepID=A0ABX3TUH8_9GAMM|nr:hypothetical protein BS639_22995 [Rouxiella silvae]
MQARNRAVRRHHMKRLKAKRCRYNNAGYSWPEGATTLNVGKAYHTPCNCSCWMCGHQRYHLGMNIQEAKARAKHQD